MKQQIQLQNLIQKNPHIQTLISCLDLHLQHNHQRDSRISARVQELINSSVLLPRTIQSFSLFRPDSDIQQYLTSTYGPKPWKYPLSSAPF